MQEAVGWLNHYQRFWSERLDRLAAFLKRKCHVPRNQHPRIEPSLTLKRRLKASPEEVYAAWTDPEKILRWFGPDSGRSSTPNSMSASAASTASASAPRTASSITSAAHYREVVPNERLVFSWAWRSTPERESLVTVLIKPDGAGSLLTLNHEQFFDEKARDATARVGAAASTSSSSISRNPRGERHGPGGSQSAAKTSQRRRAKASTAVLLE